MFFNEIKIGDKDPVQHVCFVVHGIGEACDTKFRPLIECIEDLRETSRTILQSHFKSSFENEQIHRIVSRFEQRNSFDTEFSLFQEFLPVYWHGDLHLDVKRTRQNSFSFPKGKTSNKLDVLFFFQPTGVDSHLLTLTLPSVMKLRTFINTTLSDILFYTSPVYCQVKQRWKSFCWETFFLTENHSAMC